MNVNGENYKARNSCQLQQLHVFKLIGFYRVVRPCEADSFSHRQNHNSYYAELLFVCQENKQKQSKLKKSILHLLYVLLGT